MNVLFDLNDPPYGTDLAFNGLRLARELARREKVDVRVFLMGDAVGCAMAGQKVPNGYYHLDRMVASVARRGSQLAGCGTCLEARGITDEMPTDGTRRSTLEELGDWTLWADRLALESFFALLQHNVLDRQRWNTRQELPIAIVVWIERTYHRRRRQRALGKCTPIEYETINTVAHAA